MGNFRQHITCSTATGIAIGGIAYGFGVDLPVCLVASGLCSFAGMLPDIDSDTSRSFQECMYLVAGIGCILTVSRLRHSNVDADFAMFGGAMVLLLIRFGVGAWIKKVTVHRGMIHSIPMAILAGEITFFAVTGSLEERILKATALTMGYLSHLILDEVYSIDSTGAKLRLKKSFGTALKWTNPKQQGPVAIIYALIFCLGCAALSNPDVIERRNGGVEVAKKSPPTGTFSEWWAQFSDSTKNVPQARQSDVEREATEFLSQQGTASTTVKPYSQVVTKPMDSELSLFLRDTVPMTSANSVTVPESNLPSAMQIGSDWNRDFSIQPAAIILP